jgi:signal transduction histidine kinase
MTRPGIIAAVAVAAAAAVGATCESVSGGRGMAGWGDWAAGTALLVAGVLVIGAARGRQSGLLMVACGTVWFLGTLSGTLVFLHRGPLVHLLLAYPRMRPRPRLAAAVVGAAYLDGAIWPLARNDVVTIALATALFATAWRRHRAATGLERRACAAALLAAGLVGAVLATAAALRLTGNGNLDLEALLLYDATVAVVAAGLAADVRFGRWTRAALHALVADLGSLDRPGALRARLARALGDPALVIGYPVPGGGSYVDENGQPLALPTPQHGRSLTRLDQADGQPLAVLGHDDAIGDDPLLLAAAASAVRLQAKNARLQAEVRARVVDVEASRRRLVEAALEQRRVLGAELRTGAESRLTAVAQRLARLAQPSADAGEGTLVGVARELDDARVDLRRLAHGIHPATLTERGLAAALEESVRHMPLPVELEVSAGRLSSTVEAAAYFTCAEALANVVKHAGAGSVRISVRCVDGCLDVLIVDNGHGGARPDAIAGSGLRGLGDRLQALGGRLTIESPPGHGTRLNARIPLEGAGT